MPLGDGQLAGPDGGAGAVPVVEEFEEVPAILGRQRVEPPVVDEQDVDTGELGEQAEVGAIGPGEGELVEEAGGALVEGAEALARGLLATARLATRASWRP
jgi:hypothetical protein